MIKKIFFWFIFSSFIISFYACQRKVCPAYQSSFIIDQNKTYSFFSQFGQDSLPKSSLFVNKNKRGIVVKVRYEQKQKEINTVKMNMVYPPPDSVLLAEADMSAYSEAEQDSIFALSPSRRVSYNREQEIYMRYIGQFYNWEIPDRTQSQDPDNMDVVDQEETTPKKKKPFWKKNKKEEEFIDEVETEQDEIYQIDF